MSQPDEDPTPDARRVAEEPISRPRADEPDVVEVPLFPAPQRSASLLVTGVLLTVAAVIGMQVAASLTLAWAVDGGWGDNPGTVVNVLSIVVGVFGLGATCAGLYRLAMSVDYLAARTHHQEHAAL